jgi:hypothetical protein
MSKPAFTPGPWIVDGEHSYHVIAYPDGVATTVADSDPVAMRTVADDDEAIANARLIAAAPDLYEIVRRAAEDGERYDGNDWALFCDEAAAALAKARSSISDEEGVS